MELTLQQRVIVKLGAGPGQTRTALREYLGCTHDELNAVLTMLQGVGRIFKLREAGPEGPYYLKEFS